MANELQIFGDIKNYLGEKLDGIRAALADRADAERLLQLSALHIWSMQNKRGDRVLLQCAPESLYRCILDCAALTLEPGDARGLCWFVPFGGKATFLLGYRGMISLAYRNPKVISISAHPVLVNDHFEYELGTEPRIVHKPEIGPKSYTEMRAVYAVLKTVHGGILADIMSADEVEEIRRKSKQADGDCWKYASLEMSKKTVTRRMLKYAPCDTLPNKAHEVLHVEDEEVYGDSFRAKEATDETAERLRDKLNAAKGDVDGVDGAADIPVSSSAGIASEAPSATHETPVKVKDFAELELPF